MAIAVDASSPAVAAGTSVGITTGAFTPPSNCVLWAFGQADANNGSSDETLSFSDSASGAWSTPVQDNARGGAVVAASYRIMGTSPGSMTVTMTDNKGGVAQRLFVRVMTGTDLVNPQGATTTAGTASISITSTVANSWTWSVYLGSNAAVTAGANTTLQDETAGFDSGDAVATFSATSTTPTPGTTVTLVEVGGTAVHHAAVEMVPPGTASNYAGPWTGPTPGRIGPTGQWTPQQFPVGAVYTQSLAGTLTSSAALTRTTSAAKAGTLTSAGALAKQDQKPLAGTLTSAGALAKQAGKHPAGTLTSTATLARQTAKALTGTATSAGALTTIKVVLRSFAGTLTSSGALTRTAAKALIGGLTSAGSLAKAVQRTLIGTLSTAGGLAKTVGRHLAGALAAAGALNVSLTGAAARATSTPAVTDRRTSTAAVTDRRTSTPEVEG